MDLGNPKKKYTESAKSKEKKNCFFVWISLFLSLDFPDSFENSGNSNKRLVKSKQKICFLLFGFHRFYIWISRIFVWISAKFTF
jgi:hypothetical protein